MVWVVDENPLDDRMMFEGLPTPCYVVDEGRIRHNLEILQQLEKDTGCHVLLAQKAFSMYSLYPMIGHYISGTTASSLYKPDWDMKRWEKKSCFCTGLYKAGYAGTGDDLRIMLFF